MHSGHKIDNVTRFPETWKFEELFPSSPVSRIRLGCRKWSRSLLRIDKSTNTEAGRDEGTFLPWPVQKARSLVKVRLTEKSESEVVEYWRGVERLLDHHHSWPCPIVSFQQQLATKTKCCCRWCTEKSLLNYLLNRWKIVTFLLLYLCKNLNFFPPIPRPWLKIHSCAIN